MDKDEEIRQLKEENKNLREELLVIQYAVYTCNKAILNAEKWQRKKQTLSYIKVCFFYLYSIFAILLSLYQLSLVFFLFAAGSGL